MNENDESLRCATAGSVDDGKSTLIGRLLFDADVLFQDQISHVADASKKRGQTSSDLSLVTDGLRAEREQGITIDVAWRYAKTAKRRLILADAPGHVQYTRNTLTAASTADVLVILVDAKRVADDLLPQTKRHLAAGLFLCVPHVAIAVNKMDDVGFSHERFIHIRDLVTVYATDHALSKHRPASVLQFFPVSAKDGDNVVHPSSRTPWFDGTTLLGHLENIVRAKEPAHAARFSVQWVRRGGGDVARGYSGRLVSGKLRVGDRVKLAATGLFSRVKSITSLAGEIAGSDSLGANHSATITLTDDIDVSRGDVLIHEGDASETTREVSLDVAWVGREPLRAGAQFVLKHGAKKVRAVVSEIETGYDVETGREQAADVLALNDFGRVRVRTSEPLLWDAYSKLRDTGRAILIGKENADTVAAAIFTGV